ncbi:MAG: hypothetical protein ABH871_10250 [Pseudomonadota bacterium]
MKKIKLAILFLLASFIISCGVTDVGNPTGTVILTGKIESALADANVSPLLSFENDSAVEIDTSLLMVKAFDENNRLYSADVDLEGYFNLSLSIGHTYSVFVYYGESSLGGFSFEQDDQGNRNNRLEIDSAQPDGEVIDLGSVHYRDGSFEPQNEPRRQMGSSQDIVFN